MKKTPLFILKKIQVQILDKTFQESFKMNKSDFTRARKQSFSTTLLFMINFLTKSLTIEIINFVHHLKRDCGLAKVASFTKSAFVQYRKKIKPEVFKELSSLLINEFYTDNDLGVKLWEGFRLLAVDGSTVTLPFTEELKNIYGITKNQSTTGVVQARGSVLYDVLNNYVLDSFLSPKIIGERTLVLRHVAKTRKKDLIIYDRGYSSYYFINEHCQKQVAYLMRVKISFSTVTKTFVTSGEKSKIVQIYPDKNVFISDKTYDKNTPIKVRLIRIDLPSGETEVLMTSLVDSKEYAHKIFEKLYFMRWGVETFYDELKNKLKVEHFSGYSYKSIQQDFNATIFISNIQRLIVNDIEEEITEQTKERKLKYKVNCNLSYGILKNRVVTLFFSEKDMDQIYNELKQLFKLDLIPIRPYRSNPRNIGKYRRREKPKITKNQKDTI